MTELDQQFTDGPVEELLLRCLGVAPGLLGEHSLGNQPQAQPLVRVEHRIGVRPGHPRRVDLTLADVELRRLLSYAVCALTEREPACGLLVRQQPQHLVEPGDCEVTAQHQRPPFVATSPRNLGTA